MGAVAWTVFNVLLVILIIYAWFRVLAVLRRQIGVGLAALFLLSLSAFRGVTSSTKPADNLIAYKERTRPLGNWAKHFSIPINSLTGLGLRLEGQQEQGAVRPTGFYATISGLFLGHDWEPITGSVNMRNSTLSYYVLLSHKWKLLGMPLYTSIEEFEGTVSTPSGI